MGEEGVTEAIPPQGQEGKGLLDRDLNPLPHFAARQVEELESPRDGRKILLFFRENSYFRNDVVEKEYVLRAAGKGPLRAWAAAGGGGRVEPDASSSAFARTLPLAGYEPSHSTPIQWHHCYEQEACSRRRHKSSLNFFSWFSDHSFAGPSRIAEVGPCDKPRT